ncbi:Phosphoserine phosphatase 1 [Polystyrenella longa]|uniref:Phosphoserine phosphatase 1 n=1 Tax=Polystyrenella longa TaxID=2528007 RepID=A0A518CU46_9PLAN|nr:histidine phosphatase family protein [Polystyrenella longa]QDU82747.1 Phosphoserine phosphatase 1 [Polystyrenella longa]
MASILLIHPGCTDYDEQRRIQGRLDLPLSDKGEHQADDLAEMLADAPLEVIYCGPCESARMTADRIAERLDISVVELSGLSNVDQGLWQGMKLEDLQRKNPHVFKQYQETPESICPPEGELAADAKKRIQKSVNKILKGKSPCAIVVPEPLASLIACSLKSERLEFALLNKADKCKDFVEVIRDDDSVFADEEFVTPPASPK